MTLNIDDDLAAQPLEGLEVRRSDVHGQGVFATRSLPVDHEIGGYAGRRYAPGDAEDSWDDSLTYLFGLSDGSTIDGGQGGNATRHLNHSCDPNVEAVEQYDHENRLVIAIRTLRAVEPGAELFLDYALDIAGADPASYPCACDSAECRGTIAARRNV